MSDEVDFLCAYKYESFPQIDAIILIGMVKHSQSFQNSKFAMSLQYLKREVRYEVRFLHADKHKRFYRLVLLFLMEVARHVQSTQNRELVMFLQYLQKKNIDELYFLHADKHESFLQVDTNILGVYGQTKFDTCNEIF